MSIKDKVEKLLEKSRPRTGDALVSFLKKKGKLSNLKTTTEDNGHYHTAKLDAKGNGETSEEGRSHRHKHKVIKYNIQPAMDHTHKFK